MPKLVAGWVLGTHNFNYKSSSLFIRKKTKFHRKIFLLYFYLYILLNKIKS